MTSVTSSGVASPLTSRKGASDTPTTKSFDKDRQAPGFRSTYQAALWLFRTYPLRGSIVVICLIFAGIFEGVGIASLLPLFNLIFEPASSGHSAVSVFVNDALGFIGLPTNIPILLCVIVGFISAKAIFVLTAVSVAGYSGAHINKDIRLELLRNLAAAEWSFFTNERTGNLTATLTTECDRASNAYLQIVRMLASFFQILVYFALAILVSFWVSVASAVVGLLIAWLFSRLVSIAREAGRSQNLVIRDFISRLIDGLSALKPVKAMGQERRVLPLLENDVQELNLIQRKVIFSGEALKTLNEPAVVLAAAIMLYLTIDYWQGETEILFAMILLFHRSVDKINAIQLNYQRFARNEAGLVFVQEMISKSAAAKETALGKRLPSFKKEIQFKDVCFAYQEKQILRDASMVVPANEFAALTGASGAGKTTAADLIIGLVKPSSGDVQVDGVSLRDLDIKAWRRMIGYVPQETTLFHDTIYTNVTLGDRAVSRDKVVDALDKASALEFVQAMPLGIDTIVGEHGLKFSGGQRQRMAIARALVRDPKLLILDEATTSLDPENEAAVCEALKKLQGEITILAISHQQALVNMANMVYRVQDRTIKKLVARENDLTESDGASVK